MDILNQIIYTKLDSLNLHPKIGEDLCTRWSESHEECLNCPSDKACKRAIVMKKVLIMNLIDEINIPENRLKSVLDMIARGEVELEDVENGELQKCVNLDKSI